MRALKGNSIGFDEKDKGLLSLTMKYLTSHVSRLTSHEGFRRYFANTSWLFAEKILRMVVGLFVGVWVARYLGPQQFGLLSYAQAFVGLFTAFATLGLDGIVVRELVKYPERENELLGTAFWLKLVGAFIMLGMVAVATLFTSNDFYTNLLIFIIASGTIFQAFNVIDFYFQAKVLGKYITMANSISLFISSIVKVVLILYKAPLIAFAASYVFDSFILACGFLYYYIKTNSKFKIQNLTFDKTTALRLVKDSWPLMMGGVSFTIFSSIDNIMIKEFLGERSVGIYSAAYKLITMWYFLPGLLLTSLMPSLVNVHLNTKLFLERILKISTLIVWIALLIVFLFFLFSNFIIKIIYGKEFLEASNLLPLLSFVNVFIFFNSVWNYWMTIENKTKRTLLFHLNTAIFNIILNYFLIKTYGIIGAIYALLLSLIISYIIFSFKDLRMFKMFFGSLTLKVLFRNNENII